MENEYSVATSNKYNFFLSEDEPTEILASLQTKAKKKDEKSSKDTKTDKSVAGKTDKSKTNKVLTPSQEQKFTDAKGASEENKKGDNYIKLLGYQWACNSCIRF